VRVTALGTGKGKILDTALGLQIGANIVAKANSHLGEHEIPDGSNAGPQVNTFLSYVGLDPGAPWCAAFACYVVGMTLAEMNLNLDHPQTGSSGAISSWGRVHGCVVGEDDIQPGDLGELIDPDSSTGFEHTVIASHKLDDNTWATIEGNYSNQVMAHVRDVGDCVWVRPYA
jgi:hypothetical protein